MFRFLFLLLSVGTLYLVPAQSDSQTKAGLADTVIIAKRDTIPAAIDSLRLADSLQIADSLKALADSGTIHADSVTLTGKVITGIASFYSARLDGTKTSTGEIYRNRKFTGASNNLKLNTWVRVTNLRNGKSVVVRINDRMHPRMKKKGRVIDLSRAAAKKLDFISKGLTKVKLEVIEKPKD
ncbi:MAG TPA: septal ring lytic transglycosylase RlpA family protein, partial [Sediminibacterium sp.]|nr:septal ring lytic transglycosylase RlpA family protein [Sediminibacterium sp.]